METNDDIEKIILSDDETMNDLKNRLIKVTAESKNCELDLSDISTINTVFIQLIIATKISLNVVNCDLYLKNIPSKLSSNLKKLGLNNLIMNEDKING